MSTLGVPAGMWVVLVLAGLAAVIGVAVVAAGFLRINQPRLRRVRERPQPAPTVVLVHQQPVEADAA